MPNKFIVAWLLCLVIVALSIPEWQSGHLNLKVERISLEDDPRSGRPADVINQEMIERVE